MLYQFHVLPIFNVVFIWDKDENAINNGKHILFHLSKCSDKLYGNTVFYGNIVFKDANCNKHINFDCQDFVVPPNINW